MDCKDFTRFLAQTLTGGAEKHGHLTTAEMAALTVHNRECPACRADLNAVFDYMNRNLTDAGRAVVLAGMPEIRQRIMSDPEAAEMLRKSGGGF